jgi:septum formation topological specificity factor MinE
MNLFRFFQPAASAPIARERLQILLGADLGGLVVDRKGKQTRFELAEADARTFINVADIATSKWTDAEESPTENQRSSKPRVPSQGNRVFISHRMKQKILEQVKELVAFGKFAPVVARDRESAKLSPHDVMDEMRRCDTAVIHVGADELRFDGACNEEPRISDDVLIEIIAAMALYGRYFILLVEEGVTLPANLQGLCECRYSGDELDMPATMTLFKAFNELTMLRPTRPLVFAPNHVVPHVLQHERIGTSGHSKN